MVDCFFQEIERRQSDDRIDLAVEEALKNRLGVLDWHNVIAELFRPNRELARLCERAGQQQKPLGEFGPHRLLAPDCRGEHDHRPAEKRFGLMQVSQNAPSRLFEIILVNKPRRIELPRGVFSVPTNLFSNRPRAAVSA